MEPVTSNNNVHKLVVIIMYRLPSLTAVAWLPDNKMLSYRRETALQL